MFPSAVYENSIYSVSSPTFGVVSYFKIILTILQGIKQYLTVFYFCFLFFLGLYLFKKIHLREIERVNKSMSKEQGQSERERRKHAPCGAGCVTWGSISGPQNHLSQRQPFN